MIFPDALLPSDAELSVRAQSDLKAGLPVVLHGADGPVLALAAETAPAERLAALTAPGRAVLAISAWRAGTLKIRVYDGDLARIALSADTTRAEIRALSDPSNDLSTPLKGPFAAIRDGAADIARTALALARAARLMPAMVLAPVDTVPPALTRIAPGAGLPRAAPLDRVASARLPIREDTQTRLHLYRSATGEVEHYAVQIGPVRADSAGPVLTRVHSACFTGDVLGSLKCDCGPQLHAALARMAEAGGGLLLYLNQEGRGIGLANKLRAYALQDQGFDTVEANHRLGFDDDLRDFAAAAAILRDRGVARVRLMTNNPRKVDILTRHGIEVVERVPLWVGRTEFNADYLRVKAERSGHIPE
ncbi:GTP cyclohydrolase II [Palleronia sediminis]|uniref:GTP cyclohydrolase-2 n=1 Tax=Palleronia sediminis TaxID=2547833 RepID=A0A4R6A6N7_9RHOB|nr:GTP cyclohydrolase II [Palleronia sediminis]TDL78387.1 GTP cyclohydrolase II [Palleronia sediminis]